MEEKDFPQTIEGCQKLLKQFIEITKALTVRIDKLEEENKALKELLNNNSSNSSLPPSLDKKKKKKKDKGPQNKGGWQPGHKGHSRELLESDKVDDIVKRRCLHTVSAEEGFF